MNVADRAVLVTGAAGGIGRELVLGLARAGARVAATDVRSDALGRLTGELGEDHLTLQGDVTDAAALGAVLAGAQEALGGIDILVANAGVAVAGSPLDTSDEIWDLALDVNLRHHIVATRGGHLLPAQGHRLRPMAGGDAATAGPGQRHLRVSAPGAVAAARPAAWLERRPAASARRS